MKNIKIILLLLVGLCITSCDSVSYQDISAVVTDPTYTKNVQPVIAASCTGCHGSTYPTLENYDQVVESTKNGDLLCRINGTCGALMPEGGNKLPQATINMIELWKTNNFKN